MGVLGDLQEERFWLEWKDKFTDRYNMYINPDNQTVVNYARSLSVPQEGTDYEIAKAIWRHIDSEYEYDLTKKWKQPQEAIRKGSGDCEDYVFLLGSLLPNFGVNEFEVVIGEVRVADKSEYHTWMRVSGEIVDPTANPDEMEGLEYVEEESFDVKVVQ